MAFYTAATFDQPRVAPDLSKINTYMVLGSPRSGSTMFCSMMWDIAGYGIPIEYFNPALHQAVRMGASMSHAQNEVNVTRYLKELLATRTTPNNMAWGIKLFPRHFEWFMQAKQAPNIVAQSKVIRISRRDRISQAVSLYIAKKTGTWNSEERPTPEQLAGVSYSYEGILACLRQLQSHDEFWSVIEQKFSLKPLDVVYEDLLTYPISEGRRVMHYLTGVPCNLDFSPETLSPKKQGTDLNKRLKEKFLRNVDFSDPVSISSILRR